MYRTIKGIAASATIALTAMAGAATAADDFPNGPVTIVVGAKPGGGLDTLSRIFAPALTQALDDQPIVVANRPGAGQLIGLKYTKPAKANGQTIVMISGSAMIATMVKETGVDVLNDFKPVAHVAVANLAVVAPKARNLNSVADLKQAILDADAAGEQLRWAHTGKGSITDVAMTSWLLANGLQDKVQDVPFAGGAPARAAIIGDQVAFGVVGTHHYLANLDTMSAIGVMAEERDGLAPDMLSFAEQNTEFVAMPAPYIVLAPKDTPDEVIEELTSAFKFAIDDPATQEKVQNANLNVVFMGGAETLEHMKALMDAWRPTTDAVAGSL
ncbi:tripartite tricarboxylate transporter substrate binding protein [Shimia sp. R10_1]|uniref:tripartite tricarboxylate transporter substrate binding protein n=1 Tax=Shimia sp. R10_1 TaxID=2821095 RepID=UPI001ADC4240|nr:tripartite tricarboxylate transporter substrate binding protein [Shimia sp. R10_1]MBO9475439.1 tripartite tricarboxylate transporter substrate binding protein [Shimia sp. R10_1]